MAMTNIQQNLLTGMQETAEVILGAQNDLNILSKMFTQESMSALTLEDLQMYPEFAHLTPAELLAGKNALDDLNTALGDFVAGTIVTRLLKLVRRLPK
jgi:hypothetical protein